jgi:hypothetical protein
MKAFGYNLTHSGDKCLSVSTGVQRNGSYEFLVNALTKPRVERHIHGYAEVTTDGVVLRGGAVVKNDVDSYLGPALTLSHTTQEIARFRVSRTSNGPLCELSQSVAGNWISTEPSRMGGKIRRRAVELPVDMSRAINEYSVSMFDARSGMPSATSNQIVLPFSAPTPFGLVIRRL